MIQMKTTLSKEDKVLLVTALTHEMSRPMSKDLYDREEHYRIRSLYYAILLSDTVTIDLAPNSADTAAHLLGEWDYSEYPLIKRIIKNR